MLSRLLLLEVVLGLLVGTSHSTAQVAQTVSLAWDASPGPDVTSYSVHHGTASGVYSYATNMGNQTSASVTGLQAGQMYYLVVCARNAAGVESLPSNEITYQLPSATLPIVALTAPISGANYTSPATLNCAASVTANGHTITKVQFYNGATLLGEDATAPYGFTWSNVTAGNYSLTAKAVYDAGSTVVSSAANVTVANPSPAVVLTSPVAGTSFTSPATVGLTAAVTANGHTITKVQFYNGATLLGEAATVPYGFTWSNVGNGNYALKARAVYDSGNTVESASINIVVGALPAPWQTVNIGAVGQVGGVSQSSNIFAVSGAGRIADTADSFRFVHQPLSADGEITARLTSIQTNDVNGSFGVMMRDSLSASAKYVFMGVSQDLKFRWQHRRSSGGSTSATISTASTPPDSWVRLVRSGSTFTGYMSTNGADWTQVNTRNMTMAPNIYVGFVVASGNTNSLNTADFSNGFVVP